MRLQTFVLFSVPFILTACAVGPDYVRPPVAVTPHYKEAKGKKIIVSDKHWKIANPQDVIDRGKWWKIFHDPILNQLEARLNISNQTILNAYENYRVARAEVDQARSQFYPNLTGSASVNRQKTTNGAGSLNTNQLSAVTTSATPGTVNVVRRGGTTSTSEIFTSHSLIFNASWEPDIWGLVRRTVEASATNAQAVAALLSATQLSAQGALAQYYFELRGLDADQKLLDDTVKAYKDTLKLTRNQYAAGTAAQSDVIQAQTQVENAESLAINNGILRAQYEHAIAVLIGVPPASFSMRPHPFRGSPPPIPLQVPSALLERRPDIAQAERLVASANAEIGVAIAAYFPTLTLSGTASVIRRGLGPWFSPWNWAYGPQLMQTIFDGGLRSAAVSAARSRYEANVAAYRQVVLAAFQDVEDNLVSLRILNKQLIVQNKAAYDANRALKITLNQYKAGTVQYINVLIAQVTALSAEKSAVDINYERMVSAVGLIKALGGGWDVCAIECAADTPLARDDSV